MPKKKAFVVDDNRITAESVAKMLTLLDVESIICLGSREAIQKLATTLPDFMTLDVNMPGVSGIEVLRYIRRDPRTAHLPIIVISSEAQTQQQAVALAAGANIFLAKPVSFEHLEVAVKDALEKN
ncbi:MAG: response regulator [Chloroflexi bacterium]|nr:response regulator [Chloroflexota bacterium]